MWSDKDFDARGGPPEESVMNFTKRYLDYRFRKLKQALKHPEEHQQKALREVINSFNHTRYSLDLGYTNSISKEEFLQEVPLCRYDDLSPYIEIMKKGERNVLVRDKTKYFGESSGTTGRNKTIPLTRKYVYNCLIKGSVYTGAIVNHFVPDATSGKMVVLPGALKEIGQSLVGDVSAIMAEHIPWILRHKSAYQTNSTVNRTWEANLRDIIRSINEDKNIMGLSGLPTWNLKLLDVIRHSDEIADSQAFFNKIRYFVHGGISLEPYKERFKSLFGHNNVLYLNVYNSTEGYFAFQDDPEDEYMSLFVDTSIYYEFIPLDQINEQDPPILNLSGIETGIPYVMVVSNISGLYRYIMEDVILFGSTDPYKLKIIGRTSGFLNVFGEEVMEDMCNKVIDRLVRETGVEVNDFTIAPKFKEIPNPESMGCHEWVIEFNGCVQLSESTIARLIDSYLKELSHDYHEKRKGDLIMSLPLVYILTPGSFYKYLDVHQKIGVQSKIPRISKSRNLVNELYALT